MSIELEWIEVPEVVTEARIAFNEALRTDDEELVDRCYSSLAAAREEWGCWMFVRLGDWPLICHLLPRLGSRGAAVQGARSRLHQGRGLPGARRRARARGGARPPRDGPREADRAHPARVGHRASEGRALLERHRAARARRPGGRVHRGRRPARRGARNLVKPRKVIPTSAEMLAEVRRARKMSGWVPPDRHYHTTLDLSVLGREVLEALAEDTLYPAQLAVFRAANAGQTMREYAHERNRAPDGASSELRRAILRLEVEACRRHLI